MSPGLGTRDASFVVKLELYNSARDHFHVLFRTRAVAQSVTPIKSNNALLSYRDSYPYPLCQAQT